MRNLKIKIIFILCLGIVFGLLTVRDSFAQQGSSQSVTIDGYIVNTDVAAYGVLVSKRFNDTEGNFFDPSGESNLSALRVYEGITLDYDQIGAGNPDFVLHNGGIYFINFNDSDGNARYRNLTAVRFNMEDAGPLDWDAQRGGGKFVYDIAEAVLALEGEPADVMVISENEDITVVKSKKKYDLKIAGVISSDPKMYMGYSPEPEKDSRYKPLALAGIVLCKVSAENGAIKKGDILVSSSLPGHAMRADPEKITPGMILGSALGSLDKGEGKIYILVN